MVLRKDIQSFIRVVLVVTLTTGAFLIYYSASKSEKLPVILGKDPIKMTGGFYASDIFQILLPIVICLLCSDICQEELSNNFVYVKLIRKNRLSYIGGHILSIGKYAFVCFIILVAVPQIIGMFLSGSFSIYESTNIKAITEFELFKDECVNLFLLLLIYGFFGSMISVMFSAKAAGFLLPFALSYLLRWLRINYLKGIYPLDSSFWFSSDYMSKTKTISEGTWLLLALVLITAVIYSITIYRHITERE